MNAKTEKLGNSGGRQRAFTLVEMLIVVAILAILMSIVFRIGNVGDQDAKRTRTVVRLQRIENCLSGYYAAFGSYPPVKVMGTRDIRATVDENGDQSPRGGGNNQEEGGESLVWEQVDAACKSQPFGCEYPPNAQEEASIVEWSEELRSRVNNSGDYPKYAQSQYASIFQAEVEGPRFGDFRSVWDETDWKQVKLFKFGMMSYLLPRYLFMMSGDEEFFGVGGNACAQWEDNNDIPCDPFEGHAFSGWKDVRRYSQSDTQSSGKTKSYGDLARVANIPSQAVCARWMPNLEGICTAMSDKKFFGVSIKTSGNMFALDDETPPNPGTHYSPGGRPYKNASITVNDGWNNEFYYYSPSPYQSYSVWSAGPNGKTFPPWVSLEELNSGERATAAKWKSDDIIQMSH